jgi:hypothetical protein
VKWRGFADCSWELIESFERGGIGGLEEFRKKETKIQEIKNAKRASVSILMDNVINKDQYERVESLPEAQ